MAIRYTELRQRLGRLFNYKLKFDKENGTISFRMPGFHYRDFDRAGGLNLFSINGLTEICRPIYASGKYNHLLPHDGTDKSIMVMFAQRFSINPTLYEKASLDLPLICKSQIIGLSKSSIVRRISMVEESTNEDLIVVLQKLVNMVNDTRKSCPLIPQMVEAYENIVKHECKDVFPDILPPKVPNIVYSTKRHVHFSDMDLLFHTNQASYTKFVLDATSEAVKAGILSKFADDICFYNAKSACMLHMFESFAGDNLKIHVWEDTDNPYVLHYVVSKDGAEPSQMLYYSNIEFNENS